MLAAGISGASLAGNDTVILSGGEGKVFEAMEFIKNNGLSLCKIERMGSSLESLFMEVVEK